MSIIVLDYDVEELLDKNLADEKEPTMADLKSVEPVSIDDWQTVVCRCCGHKNDILLCKFRGGNLVCRKCGSDN